MTTLKKVCFVISPIGSENSDTRKRSDEVLSYIISPAAKEKGYDVVRADKISAPGLISADIFNHLLDADIVIADLTDHNPNVFYELAVRHSARKPVIQLILAGQNLPFDVAQSRTIFYRYPDLSSAQECRDKIAEQIEAIEEKPEASHNPLSSALGVRAVRESDDPLADGIAEILNLLQDVQWDVSTISDVIDPRRRLTDPDQLSLFSLSEVMPGMSRAEALLDEEMVESKTELARIERQIARLQRKTSETPATETNEPLQQARLHFDRVTRRLARLTFVQDLLQNLRQG